MTLSAPVWIVALALAACAPWFVRALSDRLDANVRRRTEALVARARARAGIATPGFAAASDRGGSHDGAHDGEGDAFGEG